MSKREEKSGEKTGKKKALRQAQGTKGAAQGTKGAAQGTKGAAQGTKGAAQGTKGAAQGTKGAAQATKAELPETPSGQRLWDMPFSAPEPRLISPELGLHNLMSRGGHNAGYDIDLTLLDAPDHRMIRSGVLLAHRVLDERGEWYLGAPDWVPLLPKELIQPMGQAELSEELADLIRPFRRRATLGPVAALRCERREFALRDDHGSTLALLRDDKVTVRRGGLTTARYREVMLTPLGEGLNAAQAEFLEERFGWAGATPMTKFPRLVRRLGAPATGLSDFPDPLPYDGDDSLSHFVTQLVAHRLHAFVRLDLSLRQEQDRKTLVDLVDVLAGFCDELVTLASLLDVAWAQDLREELGWVIAALRDELDPGPGESRLQARLRGERYLGLIDRLVVAARAARAGSAAEEPARQTLETLRDSRIERVRRSGDRLSVDSVAELWEDARTAFSEIAGVDDLVQLVGGHGLGRTRERLAEGERLLGLVHDQHVRAAQLIEQVEEMSPADAFEAGRQLERDQEQERVVRAQFVELWAKTHKKLVKAQQHPAGRS